MTPLASVALAVKHLAPAFERKGLHRGFVLGLLTGGFLALLAYRYGKIIGLAEGHLISSIEDVPWFVSPGRRT